MVIGEAGALLRKIIRTQQRNRIGPGLQLIAHRIAERSLNIGVDDTPKCGNLAVDHRFGGLLSFSCAGVKDPDALAPVF